MEGTSSWSGGSMDVNSWDGRESVMGEIEVMSWSWLGRRSWDGLRGISGFWGITSIGVNKYLLFTLA